jgi:hypothetical protein
VLALVEEDLIFLGCQVTPSAKVLDAVFLVSFHKSSLGLIDILYYPHSEGISYAFVILVALLLDFDLDILQLEPLF